MCLNNTDKSGLDKNINDADKKYLILVDLLKKSNYNTNITENEYKRNNTLNVTDDVDKIAYDAKISDTEAKYFTIPDYNKSSNEILSAKIKQRELVNKFYIYIFIDNSNFDKKIAKLARKKGLKEPEKKILKP